MEDFEYPLAVCRDRYVTRVGGLSSLLKEGQIGFHFETLLSKTNLSSVREVLVEFPHKNKSSKSPPRPLFARKIFQIEPITDFHDSRLLAMASDGEVVFSSKSPIEAEVGEEVIVNLAIDRLSRNWKGKITNRVISDRFS